MHEPAAEGGVGADEFEPPGLVEPAAVVELVEQVAFLVGQVEDGAGGGGQLLGPEGPSLQLFTTPGRCGSGRVV
ncbi:hypothetical protein, partial [Actinocorallia populi]|uniref:hypothetical protein n=1 Tax=Actinocorallia populi TaxID=2079200 RepID=UPI001E5C4987